MITLLKIAAAAGIALSVLSPGFTPRADNCECKGKANAVGSVIPHADDCQCKAKAQQ
jgi:hypothetical protein